MNIKAVPLAGLLLLSLLLPTNQILCDPRLPARVASASDDGYASNSVIDIIEHNGGVWLAMGEGLNVSYDDGQSWVLYNSTDGMVSENVSAVHSAGNRLWIATNHDELLDGGLYSLSDAVSYSDDNGQSWTHVDFSGSGQNISYVSGGYRDVYDITGHENYVFFTAWAVSYTHLRAHET